MNKKNFFIIIFFLILILAIIFVTNKDEFDIYNFASTVVSKQHNSSNPNEIINKFDEIKQNALDKINIKNQIEKDIKLIEKTPEIINSYDKQRNEDDINLYKTYIKKQHIEWLKLIKNLYENHNIDNNISTLRNLYTNSPEILTLLNEIEEYQTSIQKDRNRNIPEFLQNSFISKLILIQKNYNDQRTKLIEKIIYQQIN